MDALWRARLRFAGVDCELEDLMLRIVQLELRVEAERGDVDRLRSGGLRAHLLALFGSVNRQLEREEDELFQATLLYDAAVQQRTQVEGLRAELIADIDELDRYAAAHPESIDLFDHEIAPMLYRALVESAGSVPATPSAAWAHAMNILRIEVDPSMAQHAGSNQPAPTREAAIASLAALRGELDMTVFGERVGVAYPTRVSHLHKSELDQALDAALAARWDLAEMFNDSLGHRERPGEPRYVYLDRLAGTVIRTQTSLGRFVNEIADVYLLYPLVGEFSSVVFAALRTVHDAPVDADTAGIHKYFEEWIKTLDRYIRDLRAKLP